MLSTQLGASALPVELCDAGGRSLGFFVPSQAFYASFQSPNSAAELARREREEGCRPLADILGDFERDHGRAS